VFAAREAELRGELEDQEAGKPTGKVAEVWGEGWYNQKTTATV